MAARPVLPTMSTRCTTVKGLVCCSSVARSSLRRALGGVAWSVLPSRKIVWAGGAVWAERVPVGTPSVANAERKSRRIE